MDHLPQVKLNTGPGKPIVQCRVSNKFAFVELRTVDETNAALSLNGIPFMGQMLKVRYYDDARWALAR